MGLLEKTHLSDQNCSALYRGPSRGLRCNDLMDSTTFFSSRSQGEPLSSVGVDAALRRVPCRADSTIYLWEAKAWGSSKKSPSHGGAFELTHLTAVYFLTIFPSWTPIQSLIFSPPEGGLTLSLQTAILSDSMLTARAV